MLTASQLRDDDCGFPETISRKDVVQTAGHHELQTEYLRGHTWLGFDEGHPDDWGAKRRGRWARSALEKAAARNGSALWRLPKKITSAVNGSVIKMGMSEIEYLTAVRQQLGFGHEGLGDRPSTSGTGELCRACKTAGAIVEPKRSQHIMAGCHSGQGERSRVHNKIIKIVTDLAGQARISFTKEMPIQVPGRKAPQRIDVVLNDVDNNVRYWVDVTKIHEMGKTSQEKAPIGTSPAIHACNTRISTKTGVYHAEAKAQNATLMPFVVGSHGAFYPLDLSHVQGGHDPAKIHKAIFGSKGPPNPRGGKVTLASEEGLIRNLANRVISDGSGAFDAELGHFQAAGQIISQTHQLIAFEATRGASRAAIAAMKNHRGYRTRPSTTPAHGRTAV